MGFPLYLRPSGLYRRQSAPLLLAPTSAVHDGRGLRSGGWGLPLGAEGHRLLLLLLGRRSYGREVVAVGLALIFRFIDGA